jgi:hypothetical protein
VGYAARVRSGRRVVGRVGTYGGRSALMRIGGSPLATTPKAALGVIAELCQPALAKAA